MICRLEDRCLIRVSGADAESFLQNLVTNDVVRLGDERLLYACLLTPQGRFLHDLFISRTEGGFYLECETQRRDDLLRRLNVFKFRSKVAIEDCAALFDVYATDDDKRGMPDPRLPALGRRFYLPVTERIKNTDSPVLYKDRRISLGVLEGGTEMKPEMDTIADINLDRLNAVSWDKGCYVGQEVTARMNNRGLIKKRLAIVSGRDMQELEMRAVHSSGTSGLAVIRLSEPGNARMPEYIITDV